MSDCCSCDTAVSSHCRSGMYFTIVVADNCNNGGQAQQLPPPSYTPSYVTSPANIARTPPPPRYPACKVHDINFPKLYYASASTVRRFSINCCDTVRVSWAAGSIGRTHGLQQLAADGPLTWPGGLDGCMVCVCVCVCVCDLETA